LTGAPPRNQLRELTALPQHFSWIVRGPNSKGRKERKRRKGRKKKREARSVQFTFLATQLCKSIYKIHIKTTYKRLYTTPAPRIMQSKIILHGGPKNMTLYFCPYLGQLLADFQNSFTDTLRRQFAIM